MTVNPKLSNHLNNLNKKSIKNNNFNWIKFSVKVGTKLLWREFYIRMHIYSFNCKLNCKLILELNYQIKTLSNGVQWN